MIVLALQIGRSNFAAGSVGDEDGDLLRIPVPARGAWDSCRDLLLQAAAGGEVAAVGIACEGPIDMAAGVVAPAGIPQWRTGFALVDAVRKLFPTAAVQLALDGVCLAMAERTFGATRSVMDSLAISLAEHIGGGITIGGFGVVGRTGNGGNIGHVLVPGFDEPCDCGGRGCLEAVAGGAAVLRWARSQGWSGESIRALVDSAGAGEGAAAAAIARAGTAVGLAISSAAALLDLDLVVVGGDLTAAGPLLWKPLGQAVAAHARLGYLPGLRVVPSELGEDAVLLGAGVLGLSVEAAAKADIPASS
ncbi:ROK family protein [Nocardia sp. NPDC006630]|uniref:ROK family protein n=1 Tax=Nocardia sp. NPDC006630 TaxID=3157181 RepID=UPI0033B15B99